MVVLYVLVAILKNEPFRQCIGLKKWTAHFFLAFPYCLQLLTSANCCSILACKNIVRAYSIVLSYIHEFHFGVSQEDLPVRRCAAPTEAPPQPHPGRGPAASRRPRRQQGCVLRSPAEGQRRTAAVPLPQWEARHGKSPIQLFTCFLVFPLLRKFRDGLLDV